MTLHNHPSTGPAELLNLGIPQSQLPADHDRRARLLQRWADRIQANTRQLFSRPTGPARTDCRVYQDVAVLCLTNGRVYASITHLNSFERYANLPDLKAKIDGRERSRRGCTYMLLSHRGPLPCRRCDTGQEFASPKAAADAIGLATASGIHRSIYGQAATVDGTRWEWAMDGIVTEREWREVRKNRGAGRRVTA